MLNLPDRFIPFIAVYIGGGNGNMIRTAAAADTEYSRFAADGGREAQQGTVCGQNSVGLFDDFPALFNGQVRVGDNVDLYSAGIHRRHQFLSHCGHHSPYTDDKKSRKAEKVDDSNNFSSQGKADCSGKKGMDMIVDKTCYPLEEIFQAHNPPVLHGQYSHGKQGNSGDGNNI